MVKKEKVVKTVKKITKRSSMEKCITDGLDFINQTKKKKIVKTKTMMRTIEQGKAIASLIKRRRTAPVKLAPKKAKKIAKKRATPALPDALSAIIPARGIFQPGTISIRAMGGKGLKQDYVVPKGFHPTQPTKVTIFKTKSKDHLPLPAFGFIDICFCIDATGSMSSELAQVQSTIVEIIKKIETKVQTQGINLRFGIVTYRDHPPQESSYVTEHLDFTNEHEAIKYVNNLKASGGGDEPEAVHDGLIDACQKLTWVELPGTPMLRYIFHVADAPPHGKEFLTMETRDGCICGKTTQQIFHQINIRQIHYRLIKVRNNLKVDQMEKIFRKGIVDFDSAQIGHAKEMDIRVSDMIIHEILPQG